MHAEGPAASGLDGPNPLLFVNGTEVRHGNQRNIPDAVQLQQRAAMPAKFGSGHGNNRAKGATVG